MTTYTEYNFKILKYIPFHFAEGMFGNLFVERMDEELSIACYILASVKRHCNVTYRAHKSKATDHVINRVPSRLHIM